MQDSPDFIPDQRLIVFAGDDVVAYEHGERSAMTLSSAGFPNLMFRSYNGYSALFWRLSLIIFVVTQQV